MNILLKTLEASVGTSLQVIKFHNRATLLSYRLSSRAQILLT